MYSFKSRIRYSECDEGKRLTVQALLNYFQDCSTFQSEDMGTGLDYVDEKQAGWILASWQIKVFSLPGFGREVEIGTWPHAFDKLYGYRNFLMKDASGEVLAAADSYWIYLDFEKGHPVRIPEEMIDIYGKLIEPRFPMEEAPRRISLPEGMEDRDAFSVMPWDIDTNHHMNNAKYVSYAMEYVPRQFPVKTLRVEYGKAAVLGDKICPRIHYGEEEIIVALSQENGKPYAAIQIRS